MKRVALANKATAARKVRSNPDAGGLVVAGLVVAVVYLLAKTSSPAPVGSVRVGGQLYQAV